MSTLGIKGLLRQTCTLKKFTGENDYGDPAFDAGTSKACRAQGAPVESIKDQQGRDVNVDQAFFFEKDAGVDIGDEIVFGSDSFEPVRVTLQRGLQGDSHISVLAKRK